MPRLRLFERLSAAYRQEDRQALETDERLLQSICSYVSRLLNSRVGSTLIDTDFGMPDFIHSGAGVSQNDEPLLRREIIEFIAHYEPRLEDVQVTFAPHQEDHAALAFSIAARLKGDNSGVPVHLYSSVTPQGKVRVRL
ncbi:MAG: type VI secretion system baseplate subunit TssE [Zoogloeaceae bacterium]|jgi:type VI secretion system protein|nr:type VI secretion system baseplate subunit TssE [Zoogloeaceae bacterium]